MSAMQPDLPPTEPLPERIGGYRVLGVLGSGAFSRVYRVAREGGKGFRKELALKILAPGLEPSDDLRRMMMEEGAVARHLHHQNIVSVHEVGTRGDGAFLVMDLVEGLDLRTFLRRLRAHRAWIPLPAAVEILVQVLQGLHHAHTRTDDEGRPLGIVHRDLKPDNVLLSVDGGVKVTDFGLARIRSPKARSESGITRGTARFMSPEQARGLDIDGRSDVFSAGILLYMLLTARLPFNGETDLEVMRSVVRTQFPPVQLGRPHVPDDLARVVHRMLAPSPESRHATALYAAEALGSVIEDGWGHQPARVLADLVRRASMEQAEDSTLEEGSTRGVARRIEAALVAREES